MKYFRITLNHKEFLPYIETEIEGMQYIMTSFNDENASQYFEIVESLNKEFAEINFNKFSVITVSEDGYIYFFNFKGEKIKGKKKSYRSYEKYFNKLVDDFSINEHRIKECENEKSSKIIVEKPTIDTYKKYFFWDNNTKQSIPFTHKKVVSNNKIPLIIYFHGAGCIGYNNKAQNLEFLEHRFRFMFKKCHILLPQAPLGANSKQDTINNYVFSVKKLIDKIIEDNNNIDTNRIYIFGTSFGGGCVWSMLYNFPDFCAGSVTAMGWFDTKQADINYEKFADKKIWVAHSVNDNNVTIESDDLIVKNVRELGGEIKYTRWNKFGHNMSTLFYLKEKWVKWLFNQRLNK